MVLVLPIEQIHCLRNQKVPRALQGKNQLLDYDRKTADMASLTVAAVMELPLFLHADRVQIISSSYCKQSYLRCSLNLGCYQEH